MDILKKKMEINTYVLILSMKIKLLKKYNDVWSGIKSKIEEVIVSVIMKTIT